MSFIAKLKQRRLAIKPQDEALATKLLQSLTGLDREAIFQFFVQRRSATDIERDLGLRTGYVNQLKSSVKTSFLASRPHDAASKQLEKRVCDVRPVAADVPAW